MCCVPMSAKKLDHCEEHIHLFRFVVYAFFYVLVFLGFLVPWYCSSGGGVTRFALSLLASIVPGIVYTKYIPGSFDASLSLFYFSWVVGAICSDATIFALDGFPCSTHPTPATHPPSVVSPALSRAVSTLAQLRQELFKRTWLFKWKSVSL